MEFALICIPFFAILFAIIDFAQIYFYENSCQNALREAARFATAGSIIQAVGASGTPLYETNSGGIVVPQAIPDSEGREASRNECIRYWFLSNCVLQNFPISNISIVSAPTLPGVPAVTETNSLGYVNLLSGYTVTTNSSAGTVSTNAVPPVTGPGGATDYVQITATYYVNTITPLVGYMRGYNGIGNVFPVHVSAIVKNEPAYLNFEHTNIYSDEPQ
ncbi:MAG TPA: TadE/TadG family type IV pilus assembly protein [Candidatus Methylacidiphilales bacterium]|nr:TadE/TadG family type IV pilus assembly protein [Candidatus Methylacidiphilales bacterium]